MLLKVLGVREPTCSDVDNNVALRLEKINKIAALGWLVI